LPDDVPDFAPLPGEERESALYLSELAYIDREIGRLIDGIERDPGLSRTLVLVTADHGEAFGLHNVYEHGKSTFEEVIHVPGFVFGPGIPPAAYEHVASHRDIAATILGAFGKAAKHPEIESFGQSWFRLAADPAPPIHDFVVTYSASSHVQLWSESPLVARTDDRSKLAVGYMEGIERLYHLDSAEGERRDRAFDYPTEAARDRRQLELYRDIDSPPP
jgi:arylsulfatase A-like enzyme